MLPLNRMKSRDSETPVCPNQRPTAEIIWLDEWRRRRRRPDLSWRRAAPVQLARRDEAPTRHRVPIEAWLMALIVFSAMAGAIFALMGLGYMP